jgi:hypothetical protein
MLALIIGVIAAPAFVFLVFGLALGRGPVKAAAWAQYWVWQFAMIIQRPIIHTPVDPHAAVRLARAIDTTLADLTGRPVSTPAQVRSASMRSSGNPWR